jgi:hypothetical protein
MADRNRGENYGDFEILDATDNITMEEVEDVEVIENQRNIQIEDE